MQSAIFVLSAFSVFVVVFWSGERRKRRAAETRNVALATKVESAEKAENLWRSQHEKVLAELDQTKLVRDQEWILRSRAYVRVGSHFKRADEADE